MFKFKWMMSIALIMGMIFALTAQDKGGKEGKRRESSKYIITEYAPPADEKTTENQESNLGELPQDMLVGVSYLDATVLKGAYYMECLWLMKAYPEKVWVKEHVHNFDEIFGFYGSDPLNPKKLNGEVELVIDGESHLLTKSCLVFIPKGVKHCPLILKRLEKPIFMFTTGPSPKYEY